MAIDVSSWLPNLLGPVDFLINGIAQSVPKRLTLNFIGNVVIEDNAAEDRTDITITNVDTAPVTIAALDIDWSLGEVFKKALAAGGNTFTFSNAGTTRWVITVRLTSNGGGSTVTWPAAVKWPGGTEPTQSSTGVDVYTFVHDGTDIFGVQQPDFS